MTYTIRVVLGLLMAGVAACARAPRAEQLTTSGTAAECDGQSYVEVTNRFESAVDVYTYLQSGGARRFLGSVGPGTERLPLPERAGYVYGEVAGREVRVGDASRGEPGGISFTRGCDPRE